MRFDFARPGFKGQWSDEMVPGANDYQKWDLNQSKMVSGDLGGIWGPTGPIVIGRAGMTGGLALKGGVDTATQGRILIAGSANDFPKLSPSQSRSFQYSPLEFLADPGAGSGVVIADDTIGWGLQAPLVSGGFPDIYWEVPGRFMHIGARLAGISFDFVITQQPASVPTTPISILLQAHNASGSAINLPASPFVNEATWFAGSTGFSAGIYTVPTAAKNNGLYFRAGSAGTTGGTEPVWPTVVGGTVNDNGIIWTAVGRSGILPLVGLTPATYWASGAPQNVTIDMDPAPTLAGVSSVWIEDAMLMIGAVGVDPTAIITGITLSWDSIGDMQWE